MTDRRPDQFLRRLREEFDGFRVIALDHQNEDDPAITQFVHVLDVPADRLCAVEDRCWRIGLDVYGDDPLPFLLTAVSPSKSEQYFPRTPASAVPAFSWTDFVPDWKMPTFVGLSECFGEFRSSAHPGLPAISDNSWLVKESTTSYGVASYQADAKYGLAWGPATIAGLGFARAFELALQRSENDSSMELDVTTAIDLGLAA